MGRMKAPAICKKGNSESKEQLRQRAELENRLKGNDDAIYKIPEHLSKSEQIYYSFLIEEMKELNILSNLDTFLLEQTANCLHIMRQCDDNIRINGILVQKIDRFGNIEDKPNPAIKIKLDYQTKYATLCNQLGLSPASRATLAGRQAEVKAEEADPLVQALKALNE